jgi:hypothetical protein
LLGCRRKARVSEMLTIPFLTDEEIEILLDLGVLIRDGESYAVVEPKGSIRPVKPYQITTLELPFARTRGAVELNVRRLGDPAVSCRVDRRPE